MSQENKIPFFLLSFPRSGNHLCRFIIEYITNLPSAGCSENPKDIYICKNNFTEGNPLEKVDETATPVVQKVHKIKAIRRDLKSGRMQDNPGLILIFREPSEAIINHCRGDISKIESAVDWMCDIVQFYKKFKGPKLMLRYESLITAEDESLDALTSFLGGFVNADRLCEFKENRAELLSQSRSAKGRFWKAPTSGSDLNFHKQSASNEELQEFNKHWELKTNGRPLI